MRRSFFILRLIILAAFGITGCKNEDLFFITVCTGPPSVVTLPPEEVTSNTAALSGYITSAGIGNTIETGIYIYESSESPEQQLSPVWGTAEKIYSDFFSEGLFYVYITDLEPATIYSYLAFATNETGTFYGDIRILVTSYGTVEDNNGNIYQTVKIGDQIWMRENLRSNMYPCGAKINECFNSSDDDSLGKYYNWQAANGSGFKQVQGADACPAGWHIPSDTEWQKLLTYIGIPPYQLKTFGFVGDNQAAMLKDSGSNYWKDEDISNSTGFSVLPAGVYINKGDMLGPIPLTAFWTSTQYIYYGFGRDTEMIIRGNGTRSNTYLSVRCIKN